MSSIRKPLGACLLLLLVPAVAPAQEVFKEISAKRLEDILSSMDLKFQKIEDTKVKGQTYYDFKSKNLILRLTNFSGKDLMIDILLPAIEWNKVNEWNKTAKFSRASLRKDAKGLDSVALESNLDLMGGVTEDTIKHFIRNFDREINSFAQFTSPAAAQDEVYKGIPVARLEKILDGMGIKYKKSKGSGPNDVYYDYTKNNYQIRLSNYGGEELLIDCIFPASTVAKVNAWNVKRHYIRAVLFPGDGMPYTSLESYLDCIGGTSDSIIRYFINTFDVELRDFDKYLQGK